MRIAAQTASLHKDLADSFYLIFSDDEMRYYLNFPSNTWLDDEDGEKTITDLEKYFVENQVEISVENGIRVNVYESEVSVIPLIVNSQRFLMIMHGLVLDFCN